MVYMKKLKIDNSKIQNQTNFEYHGKEELLNSETGSKLSNRDVVLKLARGLSANNLKKLKVVEFGAGSGALAEIWRTEFGISPICIEIDGALVETLKAKGFITFKDIGDIRNLASFVYTSNVLEHIEDDVMALKKMKEKIQIGGLLAVYVPALPFLYSDFDRKVGHFRRYQKKELIEKVTLAGFKIKDCYYNDCLGIFASLAVKILGYNEISLLRSKKSLILYDRVIYPISRILDCLIFRKVIGKNLFLFAVND